MNKYISEYWQVDLPVGWEAEREEESVSIFHPDSKGTLTLSATREAEDISDDYMEDLLDEYLDAGADLYDAEYASFSGVTFCYDDGEEYWCEWYLRSGPVLLYVTYNCPLANEGEEEDVIESILESLSVNRQHSLH